MKKRFKKMTISGQIKYYYVALFLLLFLVCAFLYYITTRRILDNSENNTLEYGLQAVENNMESLMENLNDYSRVIAFDSSVQEILQKEGISYEDRMRLQDKVIHMAASCDGISSIYLFDRGGETYMAGDIYEVEKLRASLEAAMEYQSALGGKGIDRYNSVVFSYEADSEETAQIISFARSVRNLDTLETIGVLAMNVSVDRVEETFLSTAEQTGMEIAILNKDGKAIAASDNGNWLEEAFPEAETSAGKTDYRNVNTAEGKRYKIGRTDSGNGAWSIVGALPGSGMSSSMRRYTALMALLLIFGMLLCVFGASYITGKMAQPIQNILSSMEGIKEGRMEQVSIVETNQEIDELQRHYNDMLRETERLMSQKVEEQRLRRKYELSLLQAQIKPHFLYNTFDSVCALAMMGKTKEVYTMMQALGQYYRNSLHKGQEIIMVKEELDIVRNYLIIQSFRYDDVFQVEYDVDEEITRFQMIKLILQPLVENAIYHGFREHELQGTIVIRAKDDGDYIKLQVEDDGSGINAEKLKGLLSKSSEDPGKRFGLFGTMQRISLYYQKAGRKLFDIRSREGEGTVVTVWIPKGESGYVESIGD